MKSKELTTRLAVGDVVEYEDAYTHEPCYGRVVRVLGSNLTVRRITRDEVCATPKRLRVHPRPRQAVWAPDSVQFIVLY